MTPALFTTQTYTGLYATVTRTADQWRLTEWRFGQPIGHADFDRIFDAMVAVGASGLVWAGEQASRVFEQDVILAAS